MADQFNERMEFSRETNQCNLSSELSLLGLMFGAFFHSDKTRLEIEESIIDLHISDEAVMVVHTILDLLFASRTKVPGALLDDIFYRLYDDARAQRPLFTRIHDRNVSRG